MSTRNLNNPFCHILVKATLSSNVYLELTCEEAQEFIFTLVMKVTI